MKNSSKQNEINDQFLYGRSPIVKHELENEIKIIDYLKETGNGQYLITLHSEVLVDNELVVIVRENRVILLVTEKVYPQRSGNVFTSDWQSFYPKSYIRMRNVKILLPGDNFYILRHFQIAESFLLKIFLGKMNEN